MANPIDPDKPAGLLPLGKCRRLISALEAGMAGLGDEFAAYLFRPAGQACSDDIMRLCSDFMGRPVTTVDSLIKGWNRLRAARGLNGSWVREGDTVSITFDQCSCPLVASGLVELKAEHCHCSAAMLKVAFSQAAGAPVRVEVKRTVARGDGVCELVVSGV